MTSIDNPYAGIALCVCFVLGIILVATAPASTDEKINGKGKDKQSQAGWAIMVFGSLIMCVVQFWEQYHRDF